jgi:hypothetical protein
VPTDLTCRDSTSTIYEDGELGNSHGSAMQDSAKAERMGALVLPARHVRGLFLQEKSESCLVAKRLPAMARFRQLRLYTTDVTLSVTEGHQSGDDLDRIISGMRLPDQDGVERWPTTQSRVPGLGTLWVDREIDPH